MGSTAEKGDAQPRIPYPNPGWARIISMLLAITSSTLFFTHSRTITTLYDELSPALPALLMWGAAIGFIHGVGFVPRLAIWRTLFNPIVGWPLMGMGIVLIVSGK